MSETSSSPIPELETGKEENNEQTITSSEVHQDSINADSVEEESFSPEEIPTADDPKSRVKKYDFDGAGFSLEEFDSLLGKYDYNFKPGDIVNGTVFALETKGAMIDIGAKTAAFMPMQEV